MNTMHTLERTLSEISNSSSGVTSPRSETSSSAYTNISLRRLSHPHTPLTPPDSDLESTTGSSGHRRTGSGSRSSTSKRKHRHHHHKKTTCPVNPALEILNELSFSAVLSLEDRTTLARHLYSVCSGIRICHWIREPQMSWDQCQELVSAIGRLPFAGNLVFLFEPVSGRILAANRKMIQARVERELDEGIGADPDLDQFFIDYDTQGRPSFIHFDQIPWLSLFLVKLAKRLADFEEYPSPNDTYIVNLENMIEGNSRDQVLLRMVTIQHYMQAFPAVYVVDKFDSFSSAWEIMSKQKCWLGQIVLEGNDQEDDHVLLRCSFPASLFVHDEMDEPDDTEHCLDLRKIGDRVQTRFFNRLDVADVKKIWRDVNMTIEGPFEHRICWKSCSSNPCGKTC